MNIIQELDMEGELLHTDLESGKILLTPIAQSKLNPVVYEKVLEILQTGTLDEMEKIKEEDLKQKKLDKFTGVAGKMGRIATQLSMHDLEVEQGSVLANMGCSTKDLGVVTKEEDIAALFKRRALDAHPRPRPSAPPRTPMVPLRRRWPCPDSGAGAD